MRWASARRSRRGCSSGSTCSTAVAIGRSSSFRRPWSASGRRRWSRSSDSSRSSIPRSSCGASTTYSRRAAVGFFAPRCRRSPPGHRARRGRPGVSGAARPRRRRGSSAAALGHSAAAGTGELAAAALAVGSRGARVQRPGGLRAGAGVARRDRPVLRQPARRHRARLPAPGGRGAAHRAGRRPASEDPPGRDRRCARAFGRGATNRCCASRPIAHQRGTPDLQPHDPYSPRDRLGGGLPRAWDVQHPARST